MTQFCISGSTQLFEVAGLTALRNLCCKDSYMILTFFWPLTMSDRLLGLDHSLQLLHNSWHDVGLHAFAAIQLVQCFRNYFPLWCLEYILD